MRRTDFLITTTRDISRNTANSDGTVSIGDNEILQYLNDAQDRAEALIASTKTLEKLFAKEVLISVVANQESYAITDRLFMNRSIDMVEFSASGQLGDYVLLDKIEIYNRDTNTTNYPVGYSRRGGRIYLTPIPSISSGTLRVTFNGALDDLDIRRAGISTVTGLSSTTFTSITLDSTANSFESTTPNWSTIDYICIVDKDGARKARNIPWGNYNTGTNVFTPLAGYTFITGASETITTSDFCVFGKYRSTHSGLPDEWERYLIHYAVESILHKDSSDDVVMQSEKLQKMEQDLLDAMVAQTAEIQRIPQLNRYEWF